MCSHFCAKTTAGGSIPKLAADPFPKASPSSQRNAQRQKSTVRRCICHTHPITLSPFTATITSPFLYENKNVSFEKFITNCRGALGESTAHFSSHTLIPHLCLSTHPSTPNILTSELHLGRHSEASGGLRMEHPSPSTSPGCDGCCIFPHRMKWTSIFTLETARSG